MVNAKAKLFYKNVDLDSQDINKLFLINEDAGFFQDELKSLLVTKLLSKMHVASFDNAEDLINQHGGFICGPDISCLNERYSSCEMSLPYNINLGILTTNIKTNYNLERFVLDVKSSLKDFH
ncbi:hypothetical protein [Dongshaea marina]|uniref:hypothetical protein n=1 Tax=Dongshaea marina TaxID=2047966 RepID=UPI000D3E661B|nr:hypothetical protein [Dongshaea marina]